MKKHIFLITILVVLNGCCSIVLSVTRAPIDSDYLGTVILGDAHKEKNIIKIPISFEGGKWSQNSALIPCNIWAKRDNNDIYLRMSTCAASEYSCWNYQEIEMTDIISGSYNLIYMEPYGKRTILGTYNIKISGTEPAAEADR